MRESLGSLEDLLGQEEDDQEEAEMANDGCGPGGDSVAAEEGDTMELTGKLAEAALEAARRTQAPARGSDGEDEEEEDEVEMDEEEEAAMDEEEALLRECGVTPRSRRSIGGRGSGRSSARGDASAGANHAEDQRISGRTPIPASASKSTSASSRTWGMADSGLGSIKRSREDTEAPAGGDEDEETAMDAVDGTPSPAKAARIEMASA